MTSMLKKGNVAVIKVSLLSLISVLFCVHNFALLLPTGGITKKLALLRHKGDSFFVEPDNCDSR